MKKLVDDLGDKQFIIRKRATDELEEIGRYNRLLIFQAINETKDPEVLRRLQCVINAMPVK
jgi:hypothetical protein